MPINKDLNNQGSKEGFVSVPYVFGENTILDHLNTSYYHIHGRPFVYPNHASNVVLTSGSGAWGLGGNLIEIIPADTLSVSAFDLHWMNLSAISANCELQVDIYSGESGSEVLIGATRSHRNTNQSRESANRIQIPQQVAGTRISCRLSDSTSGTITVAVSVEGHYYA